MAVRPRANDRIIYQITDGYGGSVTGMISLVILTPPDFTVTSTGDSGPGTLRAALTAANSIGAGHITFAGSLSGQTIRLTTIGDSGFGNSALLCSGVISVDASSAPGASVVRDPGAPAMRLFRVATNASFRLTGLTLQGGIAQGGAGGDGGAGGGGGGAGLGGAIFTEGALSLSSCVLSSNTAAGGAGGYGRNGDPAGQVAPGGGPNGGIGGGIDVLFNPIPAGPGGFGGGGGGAANNSAHGGLGGFGAGRANPPSGSLTGGGDGGFGGGGGGSYFFGGGGGAGMGGAVFNHGGSVAIFNSSLTNNSTSGGAGGLSAIGDGNYYGRPGSGLGGALFNLNGQLAVTNTVLSGNVADTGGGLFLLTDNGSNFVTFNGVIANNAHSNLVDRATNGAFLHIIDINSSLPGLSGTFIDVMPDLTTNGAFSVAVPASAPSGLGSYGITASSGNQTLLPDSGLGVTGQGHSAVLTGAPAPGLAGLSTIAVTVSDTGVSFTTFFHVAIATSVPTFVSQNLFADGYFHLNFLGPIDTTYAVQATTNLVLWEDVGWATEGMPGNYTFIDTNAPQFKNRVYRVRTP